ncbi:MAG: helix-turn-helix transcriptional regulator [bacterium]
MWNGTAPRFDDVRQRERELNDRQRKVLDLIERGHTNREIADMLGITLDGAKWNVSEILGKLGLDSREDAADYWRWHKQRTPAIVRALRGVFGLPGLRWVAGGTALKWGGSAAAVLISVVAIGAWLNDASPTPDTPSAVKPFYLEARESIGVVVGPEEPREAVLRWSYADPNHFRSEYQRILPWFQSGTSIQAADGLLERSFDEELNLYSEHPIEPLMPWQRVRPTPTIMIGPAPADSMAALLSMLAHWDEGTEWMDNGVKRVRPAPPPPVRMGTDVFLGRRVEVIEYVRGTLWVDPTAMVILKHVSGHFSVEVTKFDTRPTFAQGTFELSKPPGARREEDSSPPTLPGAPGTSIEPIATDVEVTDETGMTKRLALPGLSAGRYVPGFVPAGWTFRQGGSDVVYVEWILRPDDWQGTPGLGALSGDFIRIEEATGFSSLPLGLEAGSEYERLARGIAVDGASWVAGGDTIIRVTASGRGSEYFDAVVQGLTRQLRP